MAACFAKAGEAKTTRRDCLVGLEGLSFILNCTEPWNTVYIHRGPTSPPGTFQWNASIVLVFRLTSGLWEHSSLHVLPWRPKLYASFGSAESGRKLVQFFDCGVNPTQQYCLALCLILLCGDIGFVYPAMSMVVIGPLLLY
jgi:hypothetical protein